MLPVYHDMRKQVCSVWVPFSVLEMAKSIRSCDFCTVIFSVFWCPDVVLFMSSTSGTQSPNVINYALPTGGVLSMVVVENVIMN